MHIRIVNFPNDVTVDEVREFLGASDEIGEILLTDAGNEDVVAAMVRVNTSQAGANAMAEFIDGRFYKDRRLSAQATVLMNE